VSKVAKEISSILVQLEECSDDILDTDIYTATKLRRLASNIALAFVDNDLLIAHLGVDAKTKKKIAAIIKEAVEKREKPKKSSRIKIKQ
jgi:hypothetical protein